MRAREAISLDYRPDVAARASALLDEHLPILVAGSSGAFSDWNVAGPMFLARARSTLRSIFEHSPPDGIGAAEELTRSLVDQMITFAWMAASPSDRTNAWVSDLHRERLKMHNRIDGLRGRPSHSGYFRSKFPDGLLTPAALAIAEDHRDHGPSYPNLLDRAILADAHWAPLIPAVREEPFAAFYAIVYSGYSFASHPSVQGGLRFTQVHPGRIRVGELKVDPEDQGPWGLALVFFLLTLIVASKTLGWPDEGKAYAVLRDA